MVNTKPYDIALRTKFLVNKGTLNFLRVYGYLLSVQIVRSSLSYKGLCKPLQERPPPSIYSHAIPYT